MDDILFARHGALGLVTLNRPPALNALTLGMIRAFARQLDAWERAPDLRTVVVRGSGARAFCAGGDVRAVYEAGKSGNRLTADFFREEYTLNHRIHVCPKPHVALLDGVVMGGGVGISVNGAFRVVTENTLFAMPETGIGLFPDVGGGYFLPRCPGETGMYLAMTGARLKAPDCLYTGIGTHFVARARLDALVEALARPGEVGETLERFAADSGPAPLAQHRAAIDRCFAGDSVEGFLAALEREGGEWAKATRAAMATKSPTSMKLAVRQLRAGRGKSLAEVLRMEYRISQGCMAGHDYYEGVRALLVDKDNAPKWKPATLAEIGADILKRHFAAPKDGDLVLD